MTRILIVEDEPNMVAGLRDNFEYEGYEVITAGDGVEGLNRALDDSPDLVVLDVMMPNMSGLDVCKQLKAKRPSVPIIMTLMTSEIKSVFLRVLALALLFIFSGAVIVYVAVKRVSTPLIKLTKCEDARHRGKCRKAGFEIG